MEPVNTGNKVIFLVLVIFALIPCICSLALSAVSFTLGLSPALTDGGDRSLAFEIIAYIADLTNWSVAFLQNLSAGSVTAIVTFYLINLVFEQREKYREQQELEHREKERYVRQMASNDNGLALMAVQELRAHGWLEDGTLYRATLASANLKGADLQGANLCEAYLKDAILEGANLDGADLKGANLEASILRGARLVSANLQDANLYRADTGSANLSWANLQDAQFLTQAQLAQFYMLWGATMPDGSKYDGRLNLPGDMEEARYLGINYVDPQERSRFYIGSRS